MNNELILTQDVVYIPTKSEIALAADKLVSNVIEGEMNALLAYGQLLFHREVGGRQPSG